MSGWMAVHVRAGTPRAYWFLTGLVMTNAVVGNISAVHLKEPPKMKVLGHLKVDRHEESGAAYNDRHEVKGALKRSRCAVTFSHMF